MPSGRSGRCVRRCWGCDREGDTCRSGCCSARPASTGCTREVLVIVAALSIQDPRERPADKQTQADQQHARFKAEGSDFASYLLLWDYLGEEQKTLSRSAFRRLCQREFLHYLRVREWQDLHQQLRSIAKRQRLDPSAATSSPGGAPDVDLIHQAILAGLLSHIGLREEETRDYLGARGARFAISPGSAIMMALAAAFPQFSDLLVAVVEGATPEEAEETAAGLAAAINAEAAENFLAIADGSVLVVINLAGTAFTSELDVAPANALTFSTASAARLPIRRIWRSRRSSPG